MELALAEFPFKEVKNNFVEMFQFIKGNEFFGFSEDFDCSENFRDFVKCAMQKDPMNRPSSIELMSHPWIFENLDDLPSYEDWKNQVFFE